MHVRKKEIVFFLNMYSISKDKIIQYNYLLHALKNDTRLTQEYTFYQFIIEHAEKWINYLETDEQLLIKYRFINEMTFDDIAIQLNYANHGNVIHKYNHILRKIERRENNEF